jgi:hypothetical protein
LLIEFEVLWELDGAERCGDYEIEEGDSGDSEIE